MPSARSRADHFPLMREEFPQYSSWWVTSFPSPTGRNRHYFLYLFWIVLSPKLRFLTAKHWFGNPLAAGGGPSVDLQNPSLCGSLLSATLFYELRRPPSWLSNWGSLPDSASALPPCVLSDILLKTISWIITGLASFISVLQKSPPFTENLSFMYFVFKKNFFWLFHAWW